MRILYNNPNTLLDVKKNKIKKIGYWQSLLYFLVALLWFTGALVVGAVGLLGLASLSFLFCNLLSSGFAVGIVSLLVFSTAFVVGISCFLYGSLGILWAQDRCMEMAKIYMEKAFGRIQRSDDNNGIFVSALASTQDQAKDLVPVKLPCEANSSTSDVSMATHTFFSMSPETIQPAETAAPLVSSQLVRVP